MGNLVKNPAIILSAILIVLAMASFITSVHASAFDGVYIDIESVSQKGSGLVFNIDSVQDKKILIDYSYGQNKFYDDNDDGVEYLSGVVDFSIEKTIFSWNADKNNACTRWEINPESSLDTTTICYGGERCCALIGISPSRDSWDTPFYLTYGMHGAGASNIISAQVVYADYMLDAKSPRSEIYFSDWKSLKAMFVSEGNSQQFSSSSVLLENSSINISINSPLSNYTSGENIRLNFSFNQSLETNYSLNSGPEITFGNGTGFNVILNGSLSYGILKNGFHSVIISGKYSSSGFIKYNHSFYVNDTIAPNISINVSNTSSLKGAGDIHLSVESNEHSIISYSLNGNSSQMDLGHDKKENIVIKAINGQNNFTLNLTDFNLNQNQADISFNYTIESPPSCNDGIKNGNEDGIDCGGSCSSCIDFTLSASKPAFNLSENVFVTVISRANSTVNITVKRQDIVVQRSSFVPVFSSAPIAETRLLGNITTPGNYSIFGMMSYLAIFEHKNITFEVLGQQENPITLQINSNSTTVIENDRIQFSATVSGNKTSLSYKWDFNKDGIIDSTSSAPVHFYERNGTFSVNLTVNDGLWNQSDQKQITVRKLINVSLMVRDNSTGSPIQNALIELNGESKNTSSLGAADFSILPGEYSLRASKYGFIAFSNKTNMDSNSLLEIRMASADILSPSISIISPQEKEEISSASVNFSFTAADSSAMSCRIIIQSNVSQWVIEKTNPNVKGGEMSFFTVDNLQNGSYRWKLECTDRQGNKNSSEEAAFIIDTSIMNSLSNEVLKESKKFDEILFQIDLVSESMKKLGSAEKEIAEEIQLARKIEKSRLAVERANRDLNSLKWRRLNLTELEEEKNKIHERVEEFREITPSKIELLDKNEFVKYPSKEDIIKALDYLISGTNYKFTKSELKKLQNDAQKLQSAISVTTKAKTVDIEFVSGKKKTVTIVHKSISYSDEPNGTMLFEMIPKDIAKNLSEIEFLFSYEVIDPDPVIKLDPNKIKDYTYIINKRISLTETEKLASLILNPNLKKYNNNGRFLTGFATLNSISRDLMKTSGIRLAIEFSLIALLIGAFFYNRYKGSPRLSLLLDRNLNSQIKELSHLGDTISGLLDQSRYDESKVLYNQMAAMFKKLDAKGRKLAANLLNDARFKLDFVYMRTALENAMNADKQSACKIYDQISSMYKSLPKQYKSLIHSKCIELHEKLN